MIVMVKQKQPFLTIILSLKLDQLLGGRPPVFPKFKIIFYMLVFWIITIYAGMEYIAVPAVL